MGRAQNVKGAIATQPTRAGRGACRARREESTAFACSVDFVLFPRNGKKSEDGYTIAKVVHEGTGEIITIKGKFGPVVEGELLQISKGVWRDDNYGESFLVWARSHEDPVTHDALLHYLEHLPGVGPTLAQAIIDAYGTNCLAKIDADPNLLLQVKTAHGRALKEDALEELIEKWEDLRAERKNMLYLSSLGFGDATAKKISAHFGADCQAKLKENPYSITEIDGIGFNTADVAARKLGIGITDPRRLAAGMEYILEAAEGDGNVCLPREKLIERAPRLLRPRGYAGQGPTLEQLEGAIDQMVADGRLWSEVREGTERIYTTEMYVIETRLYDALEKILSQIPDPEAIPSYIKAPKESVLTDEQYHALWRAREYPFTLLTGSPGTGKCVRGDTHVVADGTLRQIRHLWGADSEATFDGEGYWKDFERPLGRGRKTYLRQIAFALVARQTITVAAR